MQWLRACGTGDLAALQTLARDGADIQASFIVACAAGHLTVAQWLVAQGGVDIHAYHDEALRRTCLNGDLVMAQWLVAQGAVNPHAGGSMGFLWACAGGQVHVAKWWVAQFGVDAHACESALLEACFYGHLGVARWLVGLAPHLQSRACASAALRVWSGPRAAWMRSVVGVPGVRKAQE